LVQSVDDELLEGRSYSIVLECVNVRVSLREDVIGLLKSSLVYVTLASDIAGK
jgi:hypothetical protein